MSIFDRLNGGNMQNQLQQIQRDPLGMARQAGYQIPENLAGNPQAMVQHLLQTGQISAPMMQKIQPMLQRMGVK
jgi:hypothetical protein